MITAREHIMVLKARIQDLAIIRQSICDIHREFLENSEKMKGDLEMKLREAIREAESQEIL